MSFLLKWGSNPQAKESHVRGHGPAHGRCWKPYKKVLDPAGYQARPVYSEA